MNNKRERSGTKQAEKYVKWIIIFLMIGGLYGFISDLLVITGKIKLEVDQVPIIIFFFSACIIAGLLIKNVYWILAFVFDGLRGVAQIIASKYVGASAGSYILLPSFSIAVSAGMVCTLLSLFCFYKLLRTPDLVSKKYTYKWMRDLDDKLKSPANIKIINFIRKDIIRVMLLCAPTVLGVVAFATAKMFRPGPRMPLETMADRLFVDLFIFGYPTSLIGLPLVLIALFVGAKIAWKEGLSSLTGKAVILTLIVALAAASYVVKILLKY